MGILGDCKVEDGGDRELFTTFVRNFLNVADTRGYVKICKRKSYVLFVKTAPQKIGRLQLLLHGLLHSPQNVLQWVHNLKYRSGVCRTD